MLCISCHRQVNKQRQKVRHVHTYCWEKLNNELYDMIKEKSKAIKKEELSYNVQNKYKWQMTFPPSKLV